MNELKITDVVDQKAFEQLERLKSELDSTFAAYKKAGDAMAEGLKIKPGPYSELISKAKDYYAAIEKVYALEDKIKRIQEEQKNVLLHLNAEVQKRVKAILDEAAANDNLKKAITATNTTRQQSSSLISKEASEIEKSNIAKREAYQVDQESLKIADSILGTRQQNIVRLNQLNKELKAVVASQKDLEEKEKKGLITSSEAGKQRLELVSHERELKQSKQELNRILVNEEKTIQSSEGSYQQLSLQLERMKIAYKQMNDEEAKSTGGTKLATEIQQLDTYLKEASSSMGEHQRKVGQYENAAKGLRSEYRSMIEEIALLTLQYRALTAEEQKSASGKELQQKIDEMIQKASTLKDAMADVQDSVSKGASDTFTFDAISQGIDAIVSSMGAATGATHLLGMSDKELEEIQTDLQAAFVISNSIIRIQTALQKQSSLMKGVAAIQEAALVKATNLNTAAQGKNIIVTKAATVAQAAFNLVAKANPYVLLAMALVTVVGALALYAKGTAEVRTKQKHDELEKQKADLEQKQAKWQKANSIIQTTIATSQAIMKALAEAGPFAGPILAAVIGAMGAAQVAIIASQPIPKYAKGTDNHPGGLAIVGDGGRQEVIETDNGAYITPSVPTLVDIPKRAKVIPNLVDYRKMSLHSDALMLDRQMRSGDNGEPIIVNVNNNVGRLEQKFEDITGETKKIVRYLKKRTNLSDWKRSERNI